MSLPKFTRQMPLFGVENLLGDCFAANDPFRLFAEKVYPLLAGAREKLALAYCLDNGRPGTEPVLLMGISILQFMYRLPDRQAAEMLKYHMGWKLALGQELDLSAIDPSTLVYFRQRLLEHDQAKLAFDTVLQGLIEAGLVARRNRQRLDSTHVLGLVARVSAVDRLRETIRLALEELESRPGRPEFWGLLWERYVENKLDYRLEEAAMAVKFQETGADMQKLAGWIKEQGGEVAEGQQAKLLARVLEENFEIVEGRLEKRKLPSGAVRNPHEPEAELAAKGKNKVWVGYKTQVAETVSEEPLEKGEPTKEFVTAVVTQKAAECDETGMKQVLVEEKESGLETPEEMVVDGAYVSGESLQQAEQEGYELTGPAQEPGAKNPGFKSDAFDVDVENRKAVCPAGLENSTCTRSTSTETGKALYRFGWGEQCAGCPLKDLCLGKNQSQRSLEVGEHHTHLQQRRKEQKTEQFKETMHRRSAIEGTQSELVRGHGMRQARYRGLEKVRQQNYLIGAACNVKRWIKRMVWEMGRQANCALAQVTGAVAVN